MGREERPIPTLDVLRGQLCFPEDGDSRLSPKQEPTCDTTDASSCAIRVRRPVSTTESRGFLRPFLPQAAIREGETEG